MSKEPIVLDYAPRCEGEHTVTCSDCGAQVHELVELASGDKVCQDCYDDAPWFSNCCGYEARGIDLDYQICGSCHDHCEYEK